VIFSVDSKESGMPPGFRLHNSEKICDEKISIEKKEGALRPGAPSLSYG
jgi:hypothetical protein